MRVLRSLPFVALLAAGRAATRSLEIRSPALDDRALIDVCAVIDVDLEVELLGIPIIVGKLDVCLCLSAIPLFLKTNLVVIAAVGLVGEASVTAIIEGLINTAAPKSHCTFPEHATPICLNGNPCGFDCKDGFTPSPAKKPTQCVCDLPKTVCNGVCGNFPHCASAKPLAKRSLLEGSGACASRGEGWLACGVFGGAARAWECVDTISDLESCGGCTLPLTPYTPLGTDCTAIPGVADVSCLSGSCIVHRCLPGYVRSADSSECVRQHMPLAASFVAKEWQSKDSAMEYRLEHVPLKH